MERWEGATGLQPEEGGGICSRDGDGEQNSCHHLQQWSSSRNLAVYCCDDRELCLPTGKDNQNHLTCNQLLYHIRINLAFGLRHCNVTHSCNSGHGYICRMLLRQQYLSQHWVHDDFWSPVCQDMEGLQSVFSKKCGKIDHHRLPVGDDNSGSGVVWRSSADSDAVLWSYWIREWDHETGSADCWRVEIYGDDLDCVELYSSREPLLLRICRVQGKTESIHPSCSILD